MPPSGEGISALDRFAGKLRHDISKGYKHRKNAAYLSHVTAVRNSRGFPRNKGKIYRGRKELHEKEILSAPFMIYRGGVENYKGSKHRKGIIHRRL